ncbi:hypothetical protein ACQKMI_20845 [Lysinibacillus sp. NPDC097214]|uniref:hypothetical protein n=1 Tax=Lysinibacillus sp. NPDC097214 TaxID=3390584 RepID=UPI003D082D4F
MLFIRYGKFADNNHKPVDIDQYFATREPIGEVLSGEALAKAAIKYMEEFTSEISPEEEAALRGKRGK